jgi:hypothetical protein
MIRRIRRWTIGLTLIGVAGLIVGKTWPRERRLLEAAHKIVTLDCTAHRSVWLSDHHLLLLAEGRDKEWPNDSKWTADLVDTNVGARVPVPRLSHVLSEITGDPDEVQVSPDHQWLLWHSRQTGDGWGTAVAAKRDGTRSCSWDADRHSNLYWIDNTHWVEDERTHFPEGHERGSYGAEVRRLVLYNVEVPQKKLKVLEHTPPARELQRRIDSVYRPTFDCRYEGYQTPTQISYLTIREQSSSGNDEEHPLRSFRVTLPTEVYAASMTVSPQRQRVAYQLEFHRSSAFARLRHHFFSTYQVTEQKEIGLWTSRLDGSQMQEIGHIEIPPHADIASQIEDLRWLPDEKHVSFTFKNALYTVPVEYR